MSEEQNGREVKDCCDEDFIVDGAGLGWVAGWEWSTGSYPPGRPLYDHSLAN